MRNVDECLLDLLPAWTDAQIRRWRTYAEKLGILTFWWFCKDQREKYICRGYLHNFGEDEREKSSKWARSWNRRRTARLLRTLCGPWIIIFINIIIINFIIIIILIINIFNNHHDYSRGKHVWRVMRTWTVLTLLLVSWITKMNKWNCFEK